MTNGDPSLPSPRTSQDLEFESELDRIIETFESRKATNASLSIEAFLPPEDHPFYREIVTELIRVEMDWRSRHGQSGTLREYLERFPWLNKDDASRNAVEQEEARCRAHIAEHQAAAPSDSMQVGEVTGGDHHLTDSQGKWPAIGESLLEFEIIELLGRGTFGRVYLALQGKLSKRKVVLKFTKGVTMEPQWLARLQHSNIVPIYSVHRVGPFEVICMPYFGRRTLADEFRSQRNDTDLDTTTPANELSKLPSALRALRKLEQQSVEDMVAITGGLAHAHRRNILHGDLKPANVLMADDGTPMLLDFSLSKTRSEDSQDFQITGGTLPYMSPEQLQSLVAKSPVDLSSDIYSIGVILFEWLTGRLPFEVPETINRAGLKQLAESRRNVRIDQPPEARGVSADLWQIVIKCLAASPHERYASAQQLHEDLARHQNHQELRYAPKRSIRERVRKWRRRHPLLGSVASLTILCFVLVALLSASATMAWQSQARALAIESVKDFERDFDDVRAHLSAEPLIISDPVQAYEDAVALLADWQQDGNRNSASRSRLVRLDDTTQRQTRLRLAELHFLTAALLIARANEFRDIEPLPAALELSVAAERLFQEIGKSFPKAFLEQRATILEQLEQPDRAQTFRELAKSAEASTLQQAYLDSISAYTSGDFESARERIERVTEGNPVDFAAWFVQGNVLYKLRRYGEAEACYTRCLTLQPTSQQSRLHRGLCRIETQQWELAHEDLDRLSDWKRAQSTIGFNLALCDYQSLDFAGAIRHLDWILKREPDHVRALLLRARASEAGGDLESAHMDRVAALAIQPTRTDDWIALGVAQLPANPERAAELFEQARQIDSRSYAALLNLSHVFAMYLDENEQALKLLTQLTELYPQDAHAAASRGVILARLDRAQEAIQVATNVLEIDDSADTHYQVACIYSLLSQNLSSQQTKAGAESESLENTPTNGSFEQQQRFLRLSAQHLRRAAISREYATNAFQDSDLEALRGHRWGKETLAAIQIYFGEIRP